MPENTQSNEATNEISQDMWVAAQKEPVWFEGPAGASYVLINADIYERLVAEHEDGKR